MVRGVLVVLVRAIVGLAMVASLSPSVGLQRYCTPATGAVPSCPLRPEHKLRAGPATATGRGATVTVTCPVLAQASLAADAVLVTV